MPTISDGGFVLWESNVIVRYLAAKHEMGTLCPEDLAERADADRWMDWQMGTLWANFRPAFVGLIRTPPEKRDRDYIATAISKTTENLACSTHTWLREITLRDRRLPWLTYRLG